MMTSGNNTPISIPYPDVPDLHLRLNVGPCRLTIRPGDGDTWVSGSYTAPSGGEPFRTSTAGGNVTIEQQRSVSQLLGVLSGVPQLELIISRSRPFMLWIDAGVSELDCDLGGLPLTHLKTQQGAGQCKIDFSAANPQMMNLLEINAGVGALTVNNLGNANAGVVTMNGGAASYIFDFGGELKRDLFMRMSTGVSSVDVVVPVGTAARVTTSSFLGHLDLGDGFSRQGEAFVTQAAITGGAAAVTIQAQVGLGQLRLRTR